MPFVSYSQNLEDVLLWRALQDVREGFYIDVGAADPEHLSVTRAFYERGWSGVNVEPLLEYFQRLQADRPRDRNLRVVLGASSGLAELHAIAGTGLSTVNDAVARTHDAAGWGMHSELVPQLTLNDLMQLRGAEPIHFVKIDVEGAERAVLEGADLARFRPWILVVEATAPLSSRDTSGEWEDLILSRDYRLAIFDGLNRYYVASEHPDLLARLSVPANIFDDYVRIDDLRAREAIGAQQEAHRLQVDTLEHEHRQQVGALEREHRQQVEALELEHRQQVEALNREHQQQLDALTEQHLGQLRGLEQVSREQAVELARERAAANELRLLLADAMRRGQKQDADTRLLRATIAELRASLAEAVSRHEAMQAAAAHLEYRLRATLQSHSWRLTRPVRSASLFLRGRLGSSRGSFANGAGPLQPAPSLQTMLDADSIASPEPSLAVSPGVEACRQEPLSRTAAILWRRLEAREAMKETA